MLRLTQVKLPLDHLPRELWESAARRLRVQVGDIRRLEIERRAVDARRKAQLCYVYTLLVSLHDEKMILRKSRSGVERAHPVRYRFPSPARTLCESGPVIVGSGPAGLFCGWMLARCGLRPLILERGDAVEERQIKVKELWEQGRLDPESNVQFGEGGAGTFSDGKLYTGVRDSLGRNRAVLEILFGAGAQEDILYDAHAHLGTDQLAWIVRRLREQITEMGGQIRFRSKVTELLVRDGRVTGVRTEDGTSIESRAVVLAIGHSARDTFRMLHRTGIPMEAKSFAVGLRVEHAQEIITRAQYGPDAPEILGAASYKCSAVTSSGRSVYSFCMCPGGHVVNASSQPGRLAVNGMSNSARDSGRANSALVTPVTPEDCLRSLGGNADPLFSGLAFQEALEERAFRMGEGNIPVQSFLGFMEKRVSADMPPAGAARGQTVPAPVHRLLPEEMTAAIGEGIRAFEQRIPGFASPDTLLYGVESRTSSPVRILRGENLQSSLSGLFPCGEGAGYAGGITSAAIDGLRVAEAVSLWYD